MGRMPIGRITKMPTHQGAPGNVESIAENAGRNLRSNIEEH
jgi:hypothetical protein